MELLSWATCKRNICPTSCTEISLWKRPISNSYKLFSSYRTVFSTESSWDSKTSDLNCFYEALAQREALAICQDRVFASFLCALSLRSVFGRSIHMYWTIPDKKNKLGVENMDNLQGYWRNSKWIFRGLIRSNIEFPGVIKKKSCGISWGLCFRS